MLEPSRFDGVRLTGEGFVLRRWRLDDLEDLVLHANDSEVERGLSHRFPHPYTHADGEAFLAGLVVDLSDPVFAIEIEGQACGAVSARPDVGERSHGAELGYWLARRHWGRGVMTRVVAMYAPWVMRELALFRLEATVLDFNIGSAHVLQRNEFIQEGTLRCAVFKHGTLHDLRLFARVRRSLDDPA